MNTHLQCHEPIEKRSSAAHDETKTMMLSAAVACHRGHWIRAAASISSDASLVSHRFFATNNRGGGGNNNKSKSSSSTFRPQRRPSPSYSPIQAKKSKKSSDWSPGNPQKFITLQDKGGRSKNIDIYGPLASDIISEYQQQVRRPQAILTADQLFEENLRMADYMVADQGSTEDLVGERRALAQAGDDDDAQQDFLDQLQATLAEQRMKNLDLDETDFAPKPSRPSVMSHLQDDQDDHDDDPETLLDRNQLAHGEWSEMLVKVDRNIKLWRGGRLESYRALIVGGNMNGCGGFGFGKSTDPLRAVDLAARHCKRNIFFVDRYQNNGLTRDLVGKQNSCIVTIRATDNGLRGNPLVREILKRFGIVNAVSKSHGNRNPYNVVRATFKALMTHESIEDIALKRGKRLVSIDRAMRMQV